MPGKEIDPHATTVYRHLKPYSSRDILSSPLDKVTALPEHRDCCAFACIPGVGTAQLPPCFRVPLRLSREPDPPKTTFDNPVPSVNTSTPITLTSFTP